MFFKMSVLKSFAILKVDSIMETITDYQPILICLVKIHLQKEEEIRIPGYSQIFRNDRSGNS